MRDERMYLDDILEAAAAIERALRGQTEDEWIENEVHQAAILYRLITIGEAAGHLSKDLRDRHSEIGWSDIIGFRNFAEHHYSGLNVGIVWDTARRNVPVLAQQIAQILRDEFGEEPPAY